MTSGLRELYPGVKARASSGWGRFVLLVLQMAVPTGGSVPARSPCRPLAVHPAVGIADRPRTAVFPKRSSANPTARRTEAAIPTGVRSGKAAVRTAVRPGRLPSRPHGGWPPPSPSRPPGCPLCGRPPASSPRPAALLLRPVDLLCQRYSQRSNFQPFCENASA